MAATASIHRSGWLTNSGAKATDLSGEDGQVFTCECSRS
jgi:hypothetical protein